MPNYPLAELNDEATLDLFIRRYVAAILTGSVSTAIARESLLEYLPPERDAVAVAHRFDEAVRRALSSGGTANPRSTVAVDGAPARCHPDEQCISPDTPLQQSTQTTPIDEVPSEKPRSDACATRASGDANEVSNATRRESTGIDEFDRRTGPVDANTLASTRAIDEFDRRTGPVDANTLASTRATLIDKPDSPEPPLEASAHQGGGDAQDPAMEIERGSTPIDTVADHEHRLSASLVRQECTMCGRRGKVMRARECARILAMSEGQLREYARKLANPIDGFLIARLWAGVVAYMPVGTSAWRFLVPESLLG